MHYELRQPQSGTAFASECYDITHLYFFSKQLNQQVRTMDILSTEVVTGIISLGAVSMCIGSFITFSKEVGELLPKLTGTERRLNRYQDGMESRQSTVSELSQLIGPLKQQESNLQSYYDEMKELKLQLEREQFVSCKYG